MLSAIILVPPKPASPKHPYGPLLRTLAALVPITVEGTVRDVTLLVVGENRDVENIADEAGCRVAQAADFGTGLRQSLAASRSDWICLLLAGTIPGPTFGEDVSTALDEAEDFGRALFLRSGGGLLGRYIPAFSTIAGIIAPKTRLASAACGSFADVVRCARPARSLPSSVAFL